MKIMLLIACGIAGCWPASLSAAERPNVLLIAIDDLNDWTGSFGSVVL